MTTSWADAGTSADLVAEVHRRARPMVVGATYWLGLAAGWVRAGLVVSGASDRAVHLLGAVRALRGRGAGRMAVRSSAWLLIGAGVLTFAASIAVPAWFGLHGQRLLIVTSGSMSPFVEAGDAVVLQAIDDPSQLRIGQVASFWPPGGTHLVTHRIVDLRMIPAMEPDPATGAMVPLHDASGSVVQRPFILTKGDANATNDPNATPLARVRGVVVGAHAGWGFALDWAGSARGRMVMLVPPLVLLAALELGDTVSERRRRPRARPAPEPQEDRFDAYLLG